LTYQQLNEKANQLAHYLQLQGVKPDILVGLCLERSIEVVISIIAILKAGGAYVPLELAYPDERLNFIINDAKAAILLTHSQLQNKFSQINETNAIYIDKINNELELQSKQNTNSNVTPENLCYVIYTSGSTGQPKGCLIQHNNVTRLFSQTQAWYQFNQNDVWTLFHSYAFDFSVWELWGALIYGGKLVIVPYWISRSTEDFYQLLQQHKVTVLNQTPSAFYQLIQVDKQYINQKLDLRYVIFGGEALDIPALKHWFDKNSDKKPQLVNMYGITETTVHVTYRTLSKADLDSNASVIGQPIPDLNLYILDKYQNHVPINIMGEMYVGGLGVARGYLNRDELTAQRFIQSPFNPKQKLYRTGDLARYLPNGDIEYLGRIDQQVKIRGFRIELGEIESVLSNYPDIQASCIIIREDKPNNKTIVAYFIAQETIQLDDLRAFMQQPLPDYMLPKVFIQLEKFPLTPNGKIDHKALPAPESNRRTNEQDFIEPKTEIEQALAKIWSDVLNIEKISINDNFFVLGGDSILSIQVVARANQQQIKLTPRLIFQYQTIAQLVSVAEISQLTQAQQDLVTGEIPLTAIQHWFFAQNLANPHYYNQSILLNLANDTQVDLLEKAIQYLLIHHDVLRLQFQKVDERWQQHNLAETKAFELKIVDLQDDAQILAETQTAQSSLNIETAQLIKAVLFKRTQTAYLFITIHHLAVDGVSWRILLEDLSTVYQQLSQQQKLQLPAKTTAFQDWSQYLQKYAVQSEQYADFWLQQSTSMLIPVDFKVQQTANITQSSTEISLSLSAEQTTDLLQNVSQAYNTQINDILLTALALTLSEWTGQAAILLDLEAHGRESINDENDELDLSRTVGWFTSLYPVVLQISQTSDLGESIKSVKEQLRKIPNNGFDYAILRYLTQNSEIRQQLQDLPAAQISFNYLGQFGQSVENNLFLGIATEKTAGYHAKENQRAYLLDFNLIILNRQLKINCTYNQAFHCSETIEQLIQNYMAHLQSLIEHCLHPQAGGYTPSDFPEADLNQDDLDNLLDQL
ncbi:MAG: amino acid adenylation domain-containing protein, partial [Thiotrichaceae bacterium]|nr:amino acid adenylation domain-containing protein [Thiotrichaceae bacterium]